ncbi:775_t:CDS:10 [Gigaspora rosea]|nr:775_t:CDS:10 [Gigaspora rosea]
MAQDSTEIKETIGALDDYVLLGRSGLRISPMCLGALTFGDTHGFGSNYEESKKVFDYYFEKGGNFIDTANAYNGGESERFLGEYIADKRSQIVLSTKYSLNDTAMMPNVKFNPNAGGNHRKSLVENLDESLKRLGTGYVDLLYLHLWDFRTPIEEVMRSFDDVVRSGKVHYVAISDTPAWVISRANTMAELRGWSQFIGLQTRYNLLNRSLEYDLQSACAELDVGIIPWGCVAEGFLTGKYTRESIANLKKAGDSSPRNFSIFRSAENEQCWKILDEVTAIATEIKRIHLVENLKTLEFKLTPEQMSRLDAISLPEIQFPYTMYPTLENVVCKGIRAPNKYRPMINLVTQEKRRW